MRTTTRPASAMIVGIGWGLSQPQWSPEGGTSIAGLPAEKPQGSGLKPIVATSDSSSRIVYWRHSLTDSSGTGPESQVGVKSCDS